MPEQSNNDDINPTDDSPSESDVEASLGRSLRAVLQDTAVGELILRSPEELEFSRWVEYFLPGVLGEIHPEWENEALDGIYPSWIKKTGATSLEMFGLALLISDQTFVPFHLHLATSPTDDAITWVECRLGERGPQGMLRTPYGTPQIIAKRLARVDHNVDRIDWYYRVTYGDKKL
ncbi:MAG: hypothetical protein AB7O62_05765 [Pirellulales bacterium]